MGFWEQTETQFALKSSSLVITFDVVACDNKYFVCGIYVERIRGTSYSPEAFPRLENPGNP